MNRRAFLQLIASLLPAGLLAKFGMEEPVRQWETQGDARLRDEHVQVADYGPRIFQAIVGPGQEIRPGDFLASNSDGTLKMAELPRDTGLPLFRALEHAPASDQPRKVVVG